LGLQEDLLRGEPSGLIGIDEAGKGDYFGPLVVAACYSDKSIDSEFSRFGLRESKRVSDSRVFTLERSIKKAASHSIVAIGPERYNELHSKMRNLNRLLAWGHARALENLLAEVNPLEVVADQFGDVRFIEKALMKKGKGVKLTQRTKAEEIPAVAAASILARAEFLRRLRRLSEEHAFEFPKGAGQPVDEAAKRFVAARGREELAKIAKVHFKNTKRIPGFETNPRG
jgi:ribonuclease HIII